jgi:glycerol kinase
LLGTVLADVAGQRSYALEGSVFVAGSLMQWLRDRLGLLKAVADSAEIARSVADSGGVVVVPALAGLGAPHWRPEARGVIAGLSHASGAAEIVRASLEAMAHQCWDLKAAFAADGADWSLLRIDGGMSANDWLAQDLADMLEVSVERPADIETTARGAAMLAGVGAGIFDGLEAACAAMRSPSVRFEPAMAEAVRAARLASWHRELARLEIAG